MKPLTKAQRAVRDRAMDGLVDYPTRLDVLPSISDCDAVGLHHLGTAIGRALRAKAEADEAHKALEREIRSPRRP